MTANSIHDLVDLLNSKQYAELGVRARQFVSHFPADGQGWHLLGIAFAMCSETQPAIQALTQAAKYAPENPDIHYSLGVLLKQSGRWSEAGQHYEKTLALRPDHVEAHNALGTLFAQQEQLAEAQSHYESALRFQPDHPQALNNLASIQVRRGNLQEALNYYRRAIQIKPDLPEAWGNLGKALQDAKQYQEAEAAYRQALILQPHYPEALSNLGSLLNQLKRFDEAENCLQQALVLQPKHLPALIHLGTTYVNLGRLHAAENACRQAIAYQPDSADAYNNLGNVLCSAGRIEDAEQSYRQAAALNPALAAAHNNLGNTLYHQAKLDSAVQSYHAAWVLMQDSVEIAANLGCSLTELGRLDEAEIYYAHAFNLLNDPVARAMLLGQQCSHKGQFLEAQRHYQQALSLNANEFEARFDLSQLQLIEGNFKDGFRNFEARLQVKKFTFKYPDIVPQWHGEPYGKPMTGASIVLYAEQGIGDVLFFSRFMSVLPRQFSRQRFWVYAPLMRLLTYSFPDVEMLDISQRTLESAMTDQAFDWGSPLMSLAHALQIDDEKKIQSPTSYLQVAPEWQAPWRALGFSESSQRTLQTAHDNKLIEGADRTLIGHLRAPIKPSPERPLNVGLVWAGQRNAPYTARRNIPIEALFGLLKQPNCRWISLQYPALNETQMELFKAEGLIIENPMAQVNDLADTAGLISLLDLVITVDTSIAHLAGALGKPVWLLNRFNGDWRWIRSCRGCSGGRSDSPWYPTMRIFTQPKTGDWITVIQEVTEALSTFYHAYYQSN